MLRGFLAETVNEKIIKHLKVVRKSAFLRKTVWHINLETCDENKCVLHYPNIPFCI
jgi:hypothetical protein